MAVSWSGRFSAGFWKSDLRGFSMAGQVGSGEETACDLYTEGKEEESFTGEDENWIM